jgi:hypothetical protein
VVMKKVCLILGLFFLYLTAVPTYQIAREVWAGTEASRAYSVSPVNIDPTDDNINKAVDMVGASPFPAYSDITVEHHLLLGDRSVPITSEGQYQTICNSSTKTVTYKRSYHFHHQDVEILDTFQGGHIDAANEENPSDTAQSVVHILINGKDYTYPVKIPVRLYSINDNRYWGYLGFGILNAGHGKQFAIVERVADGFLNENLKWRIIRVGYDGSVQTETFSYPERSHPAYRTMLINVTCVTNSPAGFYSDVLSVYPTYWYPLVYPLGIFVIGVILTVFGLIRRNVKKST